MARTGDTLINPVTGMRLRMLQASSDTGGALLAMEATYRPGSPEPPEHLHPSQEERFEMIEGSMRVRLTEGLRDLRAGETLVVPAGVRHSMWNAGGTEARLRWETRPALRTEYFFEEIFALAAQGRVNARGVPGLRDLAVLMPKYASEIRVTHPPQFVQRVVFGVARLVAR